MTDYRIIRSNRKTLALQITDEGLLIRAPLRMPDRQIRQFVEEKKSWIEKNLQKQSAQLAQPAFTQAQLQELANRASVVIPERAAHFAAQLQVSYNRIGIRAQHTRWGSCRGAGNLNFNCLLMLTPPEVLDYVVIHELCHRKEMNHSARFWSLVETLCPDYRSSRRWLKEKGAALIRRLPK